MAKFQKWREEYEEKERLEKEENIHAGTANVMLSITLAFAIFFMLMGNDCNSQKFLPSIEIEAAVMGIILQISPINMGSIFVSI